MTKDQAIKHFGTQVSLAKAIGCKQHTVSGWGEYPPDTRQIQIERITDGALKADPRCINRLLGFDGFSVSTKTIPLPIGATTDGNKPIGLNT